MDEASLVGGVLYNAADPSAAAEILARYLVSPEPDPKRLQDLGIEQTLVEALQRALPPDPAAILRACMKGAGWVLGHRSAERIDRWELVASLPATVHLPKGLRRTTAETLVALVTQAEQSLLLTAPYVDVVAMEFLLDSLTAATERGVNVEIFEPKNWEPGPAAIAKLRIAVNQSGDLRRLRISRMSSEAPAAHLKVVVADGRVAYIGSANITHAGLSGRNVELGVLVFGPEVRVIEGILDIFREE